MGDGRIEPISHPPPPRVGSHSSSTGGRTGDPAALQHSRRFQRADDPVRLAEGGGGDGHEMASSHKGKRRAREQSPNDPCPYAWPKRTIQEPELARAPDPRESLLLQELRTPGLRESKESNAHWRDADTVRVMVPTTSTNLEPALAIETCHRRVFMRLSPPVILVHAVTSSTLRGKYPLPEPPTSRGGQDDLPGRLRTALERLPRARPRYDVPIF
jgi:hypothetical protein